MTIDPIHSSPAGESGNGQLLEAELASFPDAAVVQLLSGDPASLVAVVADLHPAHVILTDTCVTATDGDIAWSWLVSDLKTVVHGHAGWTIFDVPGISDFGVSVAAGDVDEFRQALAGIQGLNVVYQDGGQVIAKEVPVAERPVPLLLPELVVADETLMITEPVPIAEVVAITPADLSDLSGSLSDSLEAPNASLAPTVVTAAVVAGQAPKARRFRLRDRQPHVQSVADLNAPPATLTGIDARDISAWFGAHQVLDRVSLDMVAGEVTALIGPSGCGKSTFLRILNRMHEMIPSASMAGEVLVDGHDLYDPERKLTDARREIGMVFQKPNPFPAMSIYDNVLASLRLTGVKASVEVKDDIVESCLTKAGLWAEVRDRLRQPGGGLSGGQQQRLCIARALAIRPRVLLMDEPCSALDPTSTRRIEETVMQLVSEVTIVIVTHNMQQAVRVSHQCAFFLAEHGTPGVIVEHGPTPAMFGSPQDSRTSDYVTGRFG